MEFLVDYEVIAKSGRRLPGTFIMVARDEDEAHPKAYSQLRKKVGAAATIGKFEVIEKTR